MTATRGGARAGAGRPEGGPAGRSAEPYRPPLSRERMAEVRAYAKAHGLGIAAAVDVLLAFALREIQREPDQYAVAAAQAHDGRYCPNSRDGSGHSQEWWDHQGPCLWCGLPAQPAP